MQGHTYLPYDKLVRQVNELLLIDVQDYDKYLMDLTMDKKIVVKVKDNVKCVYARMYYNMEANVAAMLNNLDVQIEEDQKFIDDRIARIEDKEGITLDDIQKEAVAKAVRNGLVIVTGGPGTGKTTTINTIIKYFELEGLEIRLAAPTGRAAKRMTEACGYEAQTIHRMLEISGGVPDGDRKSVAGLSMFFERNEDNPLEADVIIVDEMSMVDISIMNSLLKAVSIGTKLILVGDVDQLPSVGPGNVLKDIIESGCFPVVKLERIFRQAAQSEIIINAHKINRGEEVVLNKYSKDFLFVHRNGADNIINAMKTLKYFVGKIHLDSITLKKHHCFSDVFLVNKLVCYIHSFRHAYSFNLSQTLRFFFHNPECIIAKCLNYSFSHLLADTLDCPGA